MRAETESALAGFSRGAIQGAALAFFIVGALAVIAVAASGGFAASLAFSQSIFAPIVNAAGIFLTCGAIAAPVGAVGGALYEGYNEYLEEKEISKHVHHAVEVTKQSEIYDIMKSTEKLTPSFEETIAQNPPHLDQKETSKAVDRIKSERINAATKQNHL